MTPMPINTGDGERLSRSNVLVKILSLSNFPFYILQCTQAFTADCTNFQPLHFWSKMPKKIFIFSAAGYLKEGYYKKKKKLKSHICRVHSQAAGEIRHGVITFSENAYCKTLSPHSKWAAMHNWAISVKVRLNRCKVAAEQTGPEVYPLPLLLALSSRI